MQHYRKTSCSWVLLYLSYLEFHKQPFGCFPCNPSRHLPESHNRTGCPHREGTTEAASLKNKTAFLSYASPCNSTIYFTWDLLQIWPQNSQSLWKTKPFEVLRFVDRLGCCTPQPLHAGTYMTVLHTAGPQQSVLRCHMSFSVVLLTQHHWLTLSSKTTFSVHHPSIPSTTPQPTSSHFPKATPAVLPYKSSSLLQEGLARLSWKTTCKNLKNQQEEQRRICWFLNILNTIFQSSSFQQLLKFLVLLT